jgi:hypothetical protein
VLLFENVESLLLGAAINQWQVASFVSDADDPDSFEHALDQWKKERI